MPSKTVVPSGAIAKGQSLEYRITVRGAVPQSWCDRLGGLRVSTASRGCSTLEGPLADQAALFGVLDILYQLNLPILEVKTLKKTKGVVK